MGFKSVGVEGLRMGKTMETTSMGCIGTNTLIHSFAPSC